MTPEEINQLSDSQLREKIKANNGSCGPITDSTRPLYQKRLLKYGLTNTPNVQPKSPEDLTDSELYEELKKHDISCGPVTETTRSVYVKRLKKHLKEEKVPAQYISPKKRSPPRSPGKEKSTSPFSRLASYEHVSPIEYRSDSSSKSKIIQTETEIEEVEFIQYKNPASQTNRYNLADKYDYIDEPTQKIYPELKPARMEFKLLDKQGFQKTNPEYFKPDRSCTTSTSSYEIPIRKLNVSPIQNDKGKDRRDFQDPYAMNREHSSNYARRLINLEPTTLFKRKDENQETNYNYRTGTCYNEQPPPQPIRRTLPTELQNSQFSWTQFLLISAIVFCVLVFIYTAMLPDQNEVVLH